MHHFGCGRLLFLSRITNQYPLLSFLELAKCSGEARGIRVQCLGTRLISLSKKYTTAPQYFPLETILRMLLSRGIQEGFAPSFFNILVAMMKAPLNTVIDALANAFRKDPFYQKNSAASKYLMQTSFHVMKDFVENSSLNSFDRR
ncbi:unnamed protein product [Gongylonema pulchrum]|uniref:Uncharacterized protein n=1 Tax=Gongylonema pulchrum TaxID=637853 RepID=A0A183DJZ3_9BILA|nr:unnamed protein product [Gongylonema pulchrum]